MPVDINLELLMIWLELNKIECFSLKLPMLLNGKNVKEFGLKLLYMAKEKRHKEWASLHLTKITFFKFME